MPKKTKLSQNEIGITGFTSVITPLLVGGLIVAIGLLAFPAYPLYITGLIGAGIGISTGMFGTGNYHFLKNRTFGAVVAILGGAGMGAGIGAILGTLVFPGLGTLVGAGIGAAIGIASTLAGFLLGALINCCRFRTKHSSSEIEEKDFVITKKDSDLSNTDSSENTILSSSELKISESRTQSDEAENDTPAVKSKTESSDGLIISKIGKNTSYLRNRKKNIASSKAVSNDTTSNKSSTTGKAAVIPNLGRRTFLTQNTSIEKAPKSSSTLKRGATKPNSGRNAFHKRVPTIKQPASHSVERLCKNSSHSHN